LDGFSMFTRLLDANFDAVHGSFSSLLRLMDVFGEFFYVIRTFAIFRLLYGGTSKLWRVLMWLVGRKTVSQKKLTSSSTNPSIEFGDYEKFQDGQRRNALPLIFVVLGITCVSAPILLARLWKALKEATKMLEEEGFENVWDSPPMARALYDFRGETEMDLSFQQGDLIKILDKPFPEWWEGEVNGRRGLFPVNFVEVMEEKKPLPPLPEDKIPK